MKRLKVLFSLILSLVLTEVLLLNAMSLTTLSSAGAATTAATDWEKQWNTVVNATKKEGRVLIYGELSSETRVAIAEPFKKRYGIELEFSGGKGNEIAERFMREQRAGLNQADVIMIGGTSTVDLKQMGLLQKLDSMLLLPEVKDAKAWSGGKFPFLDRDHTIIALVAGVTPYIVVNTTLVKEGDMRSVQDLLKPGYKSKIVFYDPTVGGTGSNFVTFILNNVYPNDRAGAMRYLRQLAAQEPIILKDARMQMEWVARGKYPLALAASFQTVTNFVKSGAPVKRIHVAEGTHLTQSAGVICVPVKPQHPNATVIFLNWLLTDEGQQNFAEAFGSAPVRAGVKTTISDPSAVPLPGERLIWQDEEFVLKINEARIIAKDIFGPLMQ